MKHLRQNKKSNQSILRGLAFIILVMGSGLYGWAQQSSEPPVVGMYVHQHWPYSHPYAARTWSLDDWRGYADGLHKLGYNTIMIWPLIDTMPDPLTSSDVTSLRKLAKVINILHGDFHMRAFIVLSANVIAKDDVAKQATFEQRHYYHSEIFVNPADTAAVSNMMKRRESALRYLAKADAFAIIDSDPGSYPGSTNQEFVDLLRMYRELFDRLRPGIELIYWVHVGWPAYGRWYATGTFGWSTRDEYFEAITLVNKSKLEPWGLAGARREILDAPAWSKRSIAFNYGAIENEPSFPFTNFGGNHAYQGGAKPLSRGVMGNAQTHCVQLPNTFAFAQGAAGKSLNDADYVKFANQLIVGQGPAIVRSWKALAGDDLGEMRTQARELENLSSRELSTGQLRGLLFGDPHRFVDDLVLQLNMQVTYREFLAATASHQHVRGSLGAFAATAEAWQRKTGYENSWSFPGMNEALRSLNSPVINRVLDIQKDWTAGTKPFSNNAGSTPFEQIQNAFAAVETYTPQLLNAMKEVAAGK